MAAYAAVFCQCANNLTCACIGPAAAAGICDSFQCDYDDAGTFMVGCDND